MSNRQIRRDFVDKSEHRSAQEAILQPDPDCGGPDPEPEWTFSYNAASALINQNDPLGRVTTYDYDDLGRVTKVTYPDPDGAAPTSDTPFWSYTYDLLGNVLTQSDALGHTSEQSYDGLYRLTRSVDANDDATDFTYDLVSNLLSLTDAEGNATTWGYDDLDRVVLETNELGDARAFAYDSVGNEISMTDRNGRVTSLDHDLTGLVPNIATSQQFNLANDRTQLTATIDTTADLVNDTTNDNLYRTTRITQSAQPGGNPVAEKRIDYTYDIASQRETVTRYADLAGTQLVATTNYTFDLAGRLTDLTHSKGATTLADYAWSFDPANRVTQFVSLADGTVDYTYDDRNQLTTADYDPTYGVTDENYTYDENGNRVTASGSGAP